MNVKVGDEVELRLAGKVVSVEGGCALVELFLARPSVGNHYRTFVKLADLYRASDQSIRQKVIHVQRQGTEG